MHIFYVDNSPQPNGDHEVHKKGCYWLSIANSKKYLGPFFSCGLAIMKAKKTFPTANGCKTCSGECHTQ